MSEIIKPSADAVAPDRTIVLETQGLPAGRAVPKQIAELYSAALELLAENAAPVAIIAEIARGELVAVADAEPPGAISRRCMPARDEMNRRPPWATSSVEPTIWLSLR